MEYPGPPVGKSHKQQAAKKTISLKGNGIWNNYFQPVSDFRQDIQSCKDKPIVSMDSEMVQRLNSWSPPWASSKAWQYDDIPNGLWNPNNFTLKVWLEPMRKHASEIVEKYYNQFYSNRR